MGIDPITLGDNVLSKLESDEKKRRGKAGLTTEERTAKRDKRRESELRGQVIGFAERAGIVVDTSDPHRKSRLPSGRPDLLLTKDSRCLYLELKTNYNKLSPEQETYIAKLVQAGNGVFVVRDYPTATRQITEWFKL